MKKFLIAVMLLVFIIIVSGCQSPYIDATSINVEQIKAFNQSKILALDGKYDKEILLENVFKHDYVPILGFSQRRMISFPNINFADPIQTGYYNIYDIDEFFELHGINERNPISLQTVNKYCPSICIRRVSQEACYVIYYVKTRDIYVYIFFEKDTNGDYQSTGEMYEATKALERDDFVDIKEGSTFKAVCNIDSSQEVAFEYKRLLNDTFVSHHITKEGVLTITYNEKVDNTTDPNDITVKSMEWSELPILEQDLPK